MQKTRPALWILAPISLALAVGSFYGALHFGPIGKPSQTAFECAALKDFVVKEELLGKAEWTNYRDLIAQYESLPANSPSRVTLVESIAMSIIDVLGHDLAIYKEMEKYPACVKLEKRKELPGIITETESSINFLNGSAPIDGSFFDPNIGSWNADYYKDFISALEFLKGVSSNTANA